MVNPWRNNYLLDTSALIWWLVEDKRLSSRIYDVLGDPYNLVMISSISIWEIVIKQKTGKVKFLEDINSFLENCPFSLLNLNLEHILQVQELPLLHRDPFDRMLVAQARVEKCVLITSDTQIKQYDVKTLS